MSLSNKGFVLKKNNLTNEEIKKIREDCLVYPEQTFGNFINNPVQIFSETTETITVPLYYAEKILNKTPDIIQFTPLEDTFINECINLRDSQKSCYSKAVRVFQSEFGGGIINMATGGGKCFGPEVKVKMLDNSVKFAKDICIGDTLLGDDLTSRKVISFTFGAGDIYLIYLEDGFSYTVNKEHTLVLYDTREFSRVFISVKNFVNLCDTSYLKCIKYVNNDEIYLNFSVLKYDYGFYYGFGVSGNKLFFLEDGSVVHNCHAEDSEILMFSGHSKKVQDIKLDDLLMGDDSTPRKVNTITTGYDTIYSVSTGPYSSMNVNKDHILVLKNSMKGPKILDCKVYWWENNNYNMKSFETYEQSLSFSRTIKHQEISEISIKNFLKQTRRFKKTFKGFRVALRFPSQILSDSPYNHEDTEVSLTNCVIYNNIEIRIKFIEGVLDRSGSVLDDCYLLNLKDYSIDFIQNFIFLCKSVSLLVLLKEKTVYIYGNTQLLNPKVIPLVNSKIDSSLFDIHLVKKGLGKYYGFTINKNNRYLTDDFVVTHNTVVSIKIACKSKLKTLIVVNKNTLLTQWTTEISRLCPEAKIGVIQGKTFEKDADIVIGMLQTISKDIINDYNWVGVMIIDEVHNIATNVFSRLLMKIRPKYIFGLTATLERKDKLEKIIKWFIGDILYTDINSAKKQRTEIKTYKYSGKSSVCKFLRDGTPAVSRMITDISLDTQRNQMIVSIIKQISNDDKRHILVISDRISQLKYFHEILGENISGLFIGGMKTLDESKTKQIILGTYSLVNEGFNVPKLNCLIFATPRSSITQAIGRIYRKHHENINPLIIDIFDDFSIFKGQYYKRRSIYKKSIENCVFIGQSLDSEIENDPIESSDSDDSECLV